MTSDTVYRVPNSSVYHTNKDCVPLQRSDRVIDTTERKAKRFRRPCKYCTGEYEHNHGEKLPGIDFEWTVPEGGARDEVYAFNHVYTTTRGFVRE